MKPIDVKSDSFAEYNEESNEKNLRLTIMSESQSTRIFLLKDMLLKIKNTLPWIYAISDLNGEEIVGSFYEKELQKTNQKELRIEKVIKTKGNKLYVKWKGYNNCFNNWIDKKGLIK